MLNQSLKQELVQVSLTSSHHHKYQMMTKKLLKNYKIKWSKIMILGQPLEIKSSHMLCHGSLGRQLRKMTLISKVMTTRMKKMKMRKRMKKTRMRRTTSLMKMTRLCTRLRRSHRLDTRRVGKYRPGMVNRVKDLQNASSNKFSLPHKFE